MSKHRLPAFTIMELTVAMLLSALVIGITYTAFRLVSQSYLDYQTKHNELAVRIRLDELMQKDFLKAENIKSKQEGLTFRIQGYVVSYEFQPAQIVRLSTIADTFHVTANELMPLFEHKPLPELVDGLGGKRIDEFSFKLSLKDGNIPYHYVKQYSSQTLMSTNTYAND